LTRNFFRVPSKKAGHAGGGIARLTFILAMSTMVSLTGIGGAAQVSPAAELQPGVVVDPRSSAVFLMNQSGGIDAVSLNSGDLRWSSDLAAKPLVSSRDRLVAQAESAGRGNVLPIVVLDANHGKTLASH